MTTDRGDGKMQHAGSGEPTGASSPPWRGPVRVVFVVGPWDSRWEILTQHDETGREAALAVGLVGCSPPSACQEACSRSCVAVPGEWGCSMRPTGGRMVSYSWLGDCACEYPNKAALP